MTVTRSQAGSAPSPAVLADWTSLARSSTLADLHRGGLIKKYNIVVRPTARHDTVRRQILRFLPEVPLTAFPDSSVRASVTHFLSTMNLKSASTTNRRSPPALTRPPPASARPSNVPTPPLSAQTRTITRSRPTLAETHTARQARRTRPAVPRLSESTPIVNAASETALHSQPLASLSDADTPPVTAPDIREALTAVRSLEHRQTALQTEHDLVSSELRIWRTKLERMTSLNGVTENPAPSTTAPSAHRVTVHEDVPRHTRQPVTVSPTPDEILGGFVQEVFSDLEYIPQDLRFPLEDEITFFGLAVPPQTPMASLSMAHKAVGTFCASRLHLRLNPNEYKVREVIATEGDRPMVVVTLPPNVAQAVMAAKKRHLTQCCPVSIDYGIGLSRRHFARRYPRSLEARMTPSATRAPPAPRSSLRAAAPPFIPHL